jgi:hypothetical protein
MRKCGSGIRNRRAGAVRGLATLGLALVGTALLATLSARAQESPAAESAVTLSSREATLGLELPGGEARSVSLREGRIVVDGEAVGAYEPGGALERSWRELLRQPGILDASSALETLFSWSPPSGEDAARGVLLSALAGLGPQEAPAPDRASTGAVSDLGSGPVSIAPGLRSIDELTRGIERLRRSLGRIGAQSRVSGEDLALVVHDDFVVGPDRVVAGDLALLDGDLLLQGRVEGDVLVLDGTLTLADGSRIDGDILQVGGEVQREGGRVLGEMVSLSVDLDDLDIRVDADLSAPEAPAVPGIRIDREPGRGFLGRIAHNIGHAIGGLGATLAWLVGLGALGLALVYFFQGRLEVVADTARLNVSRSFGVGLAGQLLVAPVALVLVVGIVTWLVLPFYLLACALAIPIGYVAAAHAVGETLSLRRYDWIERLQLHRSNSYWYVAAGLVALLAPFAVGSVLYLFGGMLGFLRGLTFFAAGVLTWAAFSTGFGALLLSRGGSRTEYGRISADDLFPADDAHTEATGA